MQFRNTSSADLKGTSSITAYLCSATSALNSTPHTTPQANYPTRLGERRASLQHRSVSSRALPVEPIWKPGFDANDTTLGCSAACTWLLSLIFGARNVEERSTSKSLRWHRLHQTSDMMYYTRRDVGPSEYLSRTQDTGMTRSSTVPVDMYRYVGLDEAKGFVRDAFCNDCRVCYERPVEIVTLPCRHGGLCEPCFRRSLFSKPVYKGGRCCPFCRRLIYEAIMIYREPGHLIQWGYSIRVD